MNRVLNGHAEAKVPPKSPVVFCYLHPNEAHPFDFAIVQCRSRVGAE